jgi:hypothetical protein
MRSSSSILQLEGLARGFENASEGESYVNEYHEPGICPLLNEC